MVPNEFRSPPAVPAVLTSDDRQWAMLAHLGAFAGYVVPLGNIIAPLVIWQVKKETSAFVADQALESLNAQITFIIYLAITFILCFLLIGLLLLPVLIVLKIVFVIMAAVATNEGRAYRYPFIFRFVR